MSAVNASPRPETRRQQGAAAASRPGSRHQNVAPDWSAVPQQTVIEIVAKGCLEDP